MSDHEMIPNGTNDVALTDLKQLWWPILVLSRGLGIFPYASVNGDSKLPWWKNLWNISSVIYIADAYVCWMFMTIETINHASPNIPWINASASYLFNTAFYGHIVLSTSLFVYYLNWKTYLRDVCQIWSFVLFSSRTAAEVNANVKRNVRCCLTWGLIGTFFYVLAYIGYFVAYNPDAVTAFMWCSWLYCLIANAVHVTLFCTFCCTASCLLKGICQDLAVIDEDRLDRLLYWFRNVYTIVIDFVDTSNLLFGNFLGCLITYCLIKACCTTYLYTPDEQVDNISMRLNDLISFSDCFVIIVAVCLVVGNMVEHGKRPYRILMKTKLPDSPTNKQLQEIMVLLDVSRNMEASFSMFGFIPISKSTLPMLFGMYLSYIFLLYQFPKGTATLGTPPTQPTNLTNITSPICNY